MPQPRRTETRVKAEAAAQAQGYRDLADLLGAAYADETPWTVVAQRLGVRAESVVYWARQLGLRRGSRWQGERGNHAHLAPVGQAQCQAPQPGRRALPRPARLALLQAAARPELSPAARAVARRSLTRCGMAADAPAAAGGELRLSAAEQAFLDARRDMAGAVELVEWTGGDRC